MDVKVLVVQKENFRKVDIIIKLLRKWSVPSVVFTSNLLVM